MKKEEILKENKDLFAKYADIKKRIKILTDEAKSLEVIVSSKMDEAEAEKVQFQEFGTFFFTKRKKWNYSDSVKNAEQDVKKLKKEEEKSGVATFEESKSLSFRNI